jgi:DNA-binding NarL/FixJ family response regulator
VGAASSLLAGQSLLQQAGPDVLLLDVGLPDGDGLALIPAVKSVSPHTQVVILTCSTDETTLMRAIDSGASGFLSKGCSLTELMNTVRRAAAGEIVMPPSLLIGLLRRMPRDKAAVHKDDVIWEQLTSREKEILSRLARGKSGEAIASELHIAPLTVRTHVRNLMSKLGVHSRLEAVAFGMKYGLIEGAAVAA